MTEGPKGSGRNGRKSKKGEPKPGPVSAPKTEPGDLWRAGSESFPVPLKTGKAADGSASPTGSSPRRSADLIDLRPDGPFRPPDFRWQLAARLAADGPVPLEWVDGWTLRAEEVLTVPPGRTVDAPDLRAAEAAWGLAGRGPFWLRVEVESRLLAGETTGAIAAKTGLTPAAVEAYAKLFYDVEDRLRHPGYVIHLVIRAYSPGAEVDVGVQVRMLAYTGGSVVLDDVLDAVDRPGVRADEDVSVGDRRRRKLARLALGLRMTPVTEANAVMWARLHFLMQECRALGVKLV